jgi:uncharacterized membrane protein YkvA (DUF1232 family)
VSEHVRDWRWIGLSGEALLIISTCAAAASAAFPPPWPAMSSTSAAILLPSVHRLATHAEHSINRLLLFLDDAGMFCLWTGLSIALFIGVVALASVVDKRMFRLRREMSGKQSRYLGHGLHAFFRIALDHHTPSSARVFLALGLAYWLLPFDLIPDTTVVPGFIDDVLVAVVMTKAFLYFCPASLVAAHAAAVERLAHA